MSLVLILILTCVICHFIRTKCKIFTIGRRIPGPRALPLIGNARMITKLKPETLFKTVCGYRARFGETYRLWLGPELWVFLHSPEETREALNDSTLTRPATFQQLSVLIGNGLLISQGKHWETHRRVLNPAFHPLVLNSFASTIAMHGDELVVALRATEGKPLDVSHFLFACILDVIIKTSMGKHLNSLTDPHNQYTQAFHKNSELLFKRMTNPLLGLDFVFKCTNMYRELHASLAVIHDLMNSVVDTRIQALQVQGDLELTSPSAAAADDKGIRKQRRTLLDTLLTVEIDGQKLSRNDICDEVNTFVFAGVDTTTAAMCFVLYSLGNYPVEQHKLIKELEKHSIIRAILTSDTLKHLEYLDLFIKEVLRYYTIVPLTGRQTYTDSVIGGRHYCAGITLWINIYGLAHDDCYFEAPEEFRPERFTKTQSQLLPPNVFIPFSSGPHICIGRKYALLIMKILTVKILLNFEVELRDPNEELVLQAQMVLKALQGFNF
ncbi:probable cytochrome P450 311a1 [Eurosta solidaginis]|uniref:probable cytochrome P450 311a1 n=1 Tax=Eurosta solidaginis TaxID=178769 RepID=UPI0035317173